MAYYSNAVYTCRYTLKGNTDLPSKFLYLYTHIREIWSTYENAFDIVHTAIIQNKY